MTQISDAAIAKMRSPCSQPTPSGTHIICIDVTNRCDLRCSNCTRLLANQAEHWDMTPENFRTALRSLAGFEGVIAMIGGNPCVHRQFPELCRIFAEEIPNKRQRGLWSNNVLEYQELIAATFGFFNLNPHGDDRCAESLDKLAALIPGLHYYKGQSQHAPLLAAVRDVIPDEVQMWDAISRCDINRNWSASIVQNKGELRAYFCEVAASFDLARGEDHGSPVVDGWWRRGIVDFADQVKRFCPGCGVPARLKARMDADETDDYTASNADIALRTRGKRKVEALVAAARSDRPVTDYSQEHRRSTVTAPKISVVIPCYNAAATIEETIASVVAQNVPAEIIVVDDGSTDSSQAAVARAVAAHPGIELSVLAASNAGAAAARNRGLRAATGELICFLDADDCYMPGFFEAAIRVCAEKPEIAAVMTNIQLVNNHREIHRAQFQAIVFSLPSNLMMRRAVVDAIGGFPEDDAFRGKGAGEDVVFKQILIAYFRVWFMPEPFLSYRVMRGSHYDLYLDSTKVVDDQVQTLSVPEEDRNGTRPAAMQAYAAVVGARISAIEAGRNRT